MSENFSFPDSPRPQDQTPVRIIASRSMLLPRTDAPGLHHTEAGQTATVPKWSIECLEAGEDYRPAPLAP